MNYDLSKRELQIVRLVALGLTNPTIGDTLNISFATVKAHITRICIKLKANNRASIVYNAIKKGYKI